MRLFFYFFIFLFFYFFPNESPSRGCWINTGRSLSVFLPVALVYFFVLLFSSLLIAVTDIRSDAQFILVVEKDAAFMRLAEDRFYNSYPCIIITGKGQPDVATRLFLKRLSESLNIPVLGLVDADPSGLKIISVYMQGASLYCYAYLRVLISLLFSVIVFFSEEWYNLSIMWCSIYIFLKVYKCFFYKKNTILVPIPKDIFRFLYLCPFSFFFSSSQMRCIVVVCLYVVNLLRKFCDCLQNFFFCLFKSNQQL